MQSYGARHCANSHWNRRKSVRLTPEIRGRTSVRWLFPLIELLG